jgi:hypothetical protein
MRYECRQCCDDIYKLPCVIIIPGDTIWSKWSCIVTPITKKAYFVSIIEL